MRIEAVTAHAFGPLDGETLTFAPGMTVMCGDNESAKSTWHAAVYAAVCGRRRRAGRASRDEQRFAQLHHPWGTDRWLVGGILVLDDGRRIELRHDLDGRVDCRATDLATGRDVSAEVMAGGAPDGSRWVGLDRRSFASTACVRQAQLLAVLDDRRCCRSTCKGRPVQREPTPRRRPHSTVWRSSSESTSARTGPAAPGRSGRRRSGWREPGPVTSGPSPSARTISG